MASTYSPNLKIELIGEGDQSGTWGTTTNTNLGTAIEEAIAGEATVTFPSDADYTLPFTNSNASQAARNRSLVVTSAVPLTSTRTLVLPAIFKEYIVTNNTTGSQEIILSRSGGADTVRVPNGARVIVYLDSSGVSSSFSRIPASILTVYNPLLNEFGSFTAGNISSSYGTNRIRLKPVSAEIDLESTTDFTINHIDSTPGAYGKTLRFTERDVELDIDGYKVASIKKDDTVFNTSLDGGSVPQVNKTITSNSLTLTASALGKVNHVDITSPVNFLTLERATGSSGVLALSGKQIIDVVFYGGSGSITWPASVVWAAGSPPTFSGPRSYLRFTFVDNAYGVFPDVWIGEVIAQNF